MKNYVTIYIPDNDNTENTGATILARRSFAAVAGGATLTQAYGAWFDDDKHLIEEPVALVNSFVSDDKLEELINRAEEIAGLLLDAGEKSVAIEINGEFIIADGTPDPPFSDRILNAITRSER